MAKFLEQLLERPFPRALGAGVEHAFMDNWTGGLEYRYSDYGSEDFGLGAGDFDVTEHTVRLGVSYKF